MTCPKCNKPAKRETIATATKVIDGNTVIVSRREALVCDKHGVLVWDPPVQTSYPVPYVPQPLAPFRPMSPWVSPFTHGPNSSPPNRLPQIMCMSGGGVLGRSE